MYPSHLLLLSLTRTFSWWLLEITTMVKCSNTQTLKNRHFKSLGMSTWLFPSVAEKVLGRCTHSIASTGRILVRGLNKNRGLWLVTGSGLAHSLIAYSIYVSSAHDRCVLSSFCVSTIARVQHKAPLSNPPVSVPSDDPP